MRRHDHSLISKELLRQIGRLGVEDIECGTRHAVLLQSFQQGRFIHQPAARRVDEVRGRFHLRKRLASEETSRRVAQRSMKRHVVARRQQLVERHHADASSIIVAAGRVSDHVQAERPRLRDQCSRDVPQSHEAQRLTGNPLHGRGG